jgi:hypothetical protein
MRTAIDKHNLRGREKKQKQKTKRCERNIREDRHTTLIRKKKRREKGEERPKDSV